LLPPRRFDGSLPPGRYLYVGNAWGPGGIRRRCARHLRPSKAMHWHVDWLTAAAAHIAIAGFPRGKECDLVHRMLGVAGVSVAVAGFGSTDCRRCPAHLLAVGADLPPNLFDFLHQ
jgi:Uri superfamily endonuclease